MSVSFTFISNLDVEPTTVFKFTCTSAPAPRHIQLTSVHASNTYSSHRPGATVSSPDQFDELLYRRDFGGGAPAPAPASAPTLIPRVSPPPLRRVPSSSSV